MLVDDHDRNPDPDDLDGDIPDHFTSDHPHLNNEPNDGDSSVGF
jgi:hypothetical protein